MEGRLDLKSFYNFIYERQLIYHRKEVLKKPFPWTKDKILQTYKFCNVYRELDAASQHLIKHVINSKAILEDKIFNIIMFRFFNTSDFFDKCMPPRHSRRFLAKHPLVYGDFDKYKKNAAIHVSGTMFPGYPVRQQILMTMEEVGERIEKITSCFMAKHSIKNYYNAALLVRGAGPFLAFQIAQDIAYIPELPKVDWNEFVVVGPGAKAGIDMLVTSPSGADLDYEMVCKQLWEWQEKYMPKAWNKIYYKDAYDKSKYLSLTNIQHSICEARKFWKLSMGLGRKRYYKQGVNNGQ